MKNNENSSLENNFKRGHPFKTLYHLFDEDRYNIVMALLFFCIKHSPFWMIPIVTANIINIASNPAKYNFKSMLINAGIMIVLIAQNVPTHTIFMRFLSKGIRNMEARLRGAILRKLQQLSISFHDDVRTGKLQSKVLRDVESVEQLSNQLISTGWGAVLNVIFAVVVTLKKEPVIALFYLITVPISTTLIRSFREKIRERNRAYRNEIESMSARISDMIEMIPVTRAHGVEDSELEKIHLQLNEVKNKGFSLDFINAIFVSSNWVTFQISQVLCLVVTGYMAYSGKMPIGDVVMYQGFFIIIVSSVNVILNIYPQLTKGFESINSLGEIIECSDIEQNEGKKKVEKVEGNFVFENVEFVYNSSNEPAIRNFSLEVKSGECIAVVGESGSGKSTLMNLVIGFRRPTSGRILLDGENMEELDLRTYRNYLAVVPQNTVLFSGSIRENIAYGLNHISDKKIAEAITMANANEFIEKLPQGVDTIIGEHGGKLSGGQRQRIAIARALVRNPRVIIFDEATSSLDVVSEALIQQAIERLAKGRTTFIVSHRLSTIRTAGRIIVMKKGECIEMGTYDELLALKGEFFKLKNLQI